MAITHLLESLEGRPDWPPTLLQLARAYVAENQRDRAVESCHRALAVDPHLTEASELLNSLGL